jgi:hypothetical protein
MCYNIPCRDKNCLGDHGVELVEYFSGRGDLPYGAAPLCEDLNPANSPGAK